MKKILIVSDNKQLVTHLKGLENLKNIKEIANFDYRYSLVNKNPQSLVELGMSPINLKDDDICEEIIAKYDLVFSLHCKQIFPKKIVSRVRCINFHPGYNPHNRGWYPQVFSIINNKPIGATVHIMDEEIDHGAIIYQKEVSIVSHDTSLDVYNKVIEAEKILISDNILDILKSSYRSKPPSVEGNYNSVEDFNALCELDLNHVGTLREHLNMLRALSHGEFENAFYRENDKKVFVRINFTVKDN